MSYHRYITEMLEAASAAQYVAPLYVERQVLNSDDLLRWALVSGYSLAELDDPSTWHVTQVYSTTPVDWMATPAQHTMIRLPAMARTNTQFGDASVLLLESPQLQTRWEEFQRAGTSWDFPSYQPHITLGKNLRAWGDVPPYNGPLTLGPERYAALQTT